jgi:hypothetical protein
MTCADILVPDLFECQMCGDCCKGFGGTVVTTKDVKTIAGYLGVGVEQMISDYCIFSGGKLMLSQGTDDYCIFWNQSCTIHAVKPSMCKAWPFIESVLIDVGNWRSMAAVCPGMRSNLSDQQILEGVRYYISKSA